MRLFRSGIAAGLALACVLACQSSSGGMQVDARYYPSGAPLWRRTYVRGVKQGVHEGWWENGRKKFEYHFRDGNYDGDVKEWYPSGAPSLHMRYRAGAEIGLQRAWRENGALYANYEVRDGKRYGVVNARLCYSVKDGEGVLRAPR